VKRDEYEANGKIMGEQGSPGEKLKGFGEALSEGSGETLRRRTGAGLLIVNVTDTGVTGTCEMWQLAGNSIAQSLDSS
jgi:hypothetical protein